MLDLDSHPFKQGMRTQTNTHTQETASDITLASNTPHNDHYAATKSNGDESTRVREPDGAPAHSMHHGSDNAEPWHSVQPWQYHTPATTATKPNFTTSHTPHKRHTEIHLKHHANKIPRNNHTKGAGCIATNHARIRGSQKHTKKSPDRGQTSETKKGSTLVYIKPHNRSRWAKTRVPTVRPTPRAAASGARRVITQHNTKETPRDLHPHNGQPITPHQSTRSLLISTYILPRWTPPSHQRPSRPQHPRPTLGQQPWLKSKASA